jgi:hypothetical protein
MEHLMLIKKTPEPLFWCSQDVAEWRMAADSEVDSG